MGYIKTYHTFDNVKLEKEINMSIDKSFYYLDSLNFKHFLEIEYLDDSKKNIKFIDNDYEWDNTKIPVYLNLDLNIGNVSVLFQYDDIICKDAILGLGIEWKGKGIRVKHSKKIGELTSNQGQAHFNIDGIKLDAVNSNFDLKLDFYLINPGSFTKDFMASTKGLILGEITLAEIVAYGSSSFFPIALFKEKDGPLWKIECNEITEMNDLEYIIFDQGNTCIKLNVDHPLYKMLDEKGNEHFMFEVFSGAFTALIIEIKNAIGNEQIDLSKNGEQGSVLTALKFFKDNYNININDTNNEIHFAVEQMMLKEFY